MEGDESLARLRRAVQEASEVLSWKRCVRAADDGRYPGDGGRCGHVHRSGCAWSHGRGAADPAGDDEFIDAFAGLSPISSPISSPSSSMVATTFNREAELEAMDEANEGPMSSGARLEAFMNAVASAFEAVEGELDARVGQACCSYLLMPTS